MRDILAEVNEALCALHVLHFGGQLGSLMWSILQGEKKIKL